MCAQFRFAMLCQAALEVPLQVPIQGSLYGQKCVFIANDWHAAMTPVYLAGKYRPHGVYAESRCILAIHNLRHQVRCLFLDPSYRLSVSGLVTRQPPRPVSCFALRSSLAVAICGSRSAAAEQRSGQAVQLPASSPLHTAWTMPQDFLDASHRRSRSALQEQQYASAPLPL